MSDLPRRAQWKALAALLTSTFLGTLANSVANVAVPAIMAGFAAPLSSAVWVVTAYVLTFAVLMPVGGHLGDRNGQRRLFLLGMALFTLASLGAGLAPGLPSLLACRVLMGVGIAPTLPAVMAITARTFSADERGRAMGFWALANGAGHALGPPLSGYLVQQVGWRAIFLVGLPLCLVCLWLVWRWVPGDSRRSGKGFDLAGAALLTAVATSLMLALNRGSSWGWGSPRFVGTCAFAALCLLLFIVVERRARSPFVELELLGDRRYVAAVGVIGVQYFCLFGLLLALPYFLIREMGLSSQAAGLLVLPLPLTAALVAPLAGRLGDVWGARWPCVAGLGVVALAALALFLLLPGPGRSLSGWAIVAGLVVMGTGMGLVQTPVTTAVTYVARQKSMGLATGVFHMGRFVSGSLGSTVFGLILSLEAGGVGRAFGQGLLMLAAAALVGAWVAGWLPGRPAQQA